jgi:putative Holliday junction resolvase
MLGLDVGERWIGVAVSEGRVAVPLTIIEHTTRDADLERIATIVRDERPTAVVVGLPLYPSGDEGPQAAFARTFGDELAQRIDLPVVFVDELLSTSDVSASALTRPRGRRRAKTRVDDRAAAVILQRYIDELERPG